MNKRFCFFSDCTRRHRHCNRCDAHGRRLLPRKFGTRPRRGPVPVDKLSERGCLTIRKILQVCNRFRLRPVDASSREQIRHEVGYSKCKHCTQSLCDFASVQLYWGAVLRLPGEDKELLALWQAAGAAVSLSDNERRKQDGQEYRLRTRSLCYSKKSSSKCLQTNY